MRKKKVLHVGCGRRHARSLHKTFQSAEWRDVRLDINPDVQPDLVGSIVQHAGGRRHIG